MVTERLAVKAKGTERAINLFRLLSSFSYFLIENF